MDIHLPGISGVAATERIRASEQEELEQEQEQEGLRLREPLIILALTGDAEDVDLQKYQESGMNGCIRKGTLIGETVTRAITDIRNGEDRFWVLR